MDIVHEVEINAPAHAVYEALTTHSGISGWWAKDCDIAGAVGDVSRMRFDKEGTIVEMHFRIDGLDSDRSVSWTCVSNPNPAWLDTNLRFEIATQGAGVKLRFAHTNWDAQWEGQPPYQMTRDTWGHFMQSLQQYCESGAGQPW